MASIDVDFEAIDKGLKVLDKIKKDVSIKNDFDLSSTKGATIDQIKITLELYRKMFKEFNSLIDDAYDVICKAKQSYEVADKTIHDKIAK